MSAATLTVRFTGEVQDLERKAKKARDVIESPMKDLEKSSVWGKLSGKAAKSGSEAGEKFSSSMGSKAKAGAGTPVVAEVATTWRQAGRTFAREEAKTGAVSRLARAGFSS